MEERNYGFDDRRTYHNVALASTPIDPNIIPAKQSRRGEPPSPRGFRNPIKPGHDRDNPQRHTDDHRDGIDNGHQPGHGADNGIRTVRLNPCLVPLDPLNFFRVISA